MKNKLGRVLVQVILRLPLPRWFKYDTMRWLLLHWIEVPER